MATTKPFMDMVEIIDEISEHIPESLYLNLFNKLKECKDAKEEQVISATQAYQRQLARQNVQIMRDVTIDKMIIRPTCDFKPGDIVTAEWINNNGHYSGKYFPAKIISNAIGERIVPSNWPINFGQQHYRLQFNDNNAIQRIQRERIMFVKAARVITNFDDPLVPVVQPSIPIIMPPPVPINQRHRIYVYTVAGLKQFCRNNDIRGYSTLRRAALIQHIYDSLDARPRAVLYN